MRWLRGCEVAKLVRLDEADEVGEDKAGGVDEVGEAGEVGEDLQAHFLFSD